ncbi:hypothetical protein M0R45_035880 [Rubus argutus]|uniref:aspartyl aminopeptidase n=1 Tax=Rubus argutus TaxID=59490 RepID=A0AAW1VYB0_RUBAR
MAAITRLQLLHPPSLLFFKSSSSLFPKHPTRSVFSPRPRNLSTAPILCSDSPHTPEGQVSKVEANGSIVGDLLDYLNESWTHFHDTAEAKRQLLAAGFHLLNENDEWDLSLVGATSLLEICLVWLRLLLERSIVSTYGGGLWHTWFDRDLSVAGRVILRDGNGSFIHKLVKVKRPLLRIPTLAIHLDRTVNKDGFKPNVETHLIPLLASKLEENSISRDKREKYISGDKREKYDNIYESCSSSIAHAGSIR